MKQKRGRLFVDPAFQGRLIGRLAAYWLIYHAILWHLMFLYSLFCNVTGPVTSRATGSLAEQYRDFAVEHFGIVVCVVVTLPIIARDLLRFSHRVAGPLIRFRNVMNQMVLGRRVEQVTMRRQDLPADFLSTFNSLVTTWNNRLAEDSPEPSDTPSQSSLELVETR